jgi:hypothetical protein
MVTIIYVKGRVYMFYNKQFSLLLLLSAISITFTSEKTSEKGSLSHLELFPGKGLEAVTLAYPYHSPSDAEKYNCVYLPEGCYTILDPEKKDSCILVGPLNPFFFLYLSIDKQTVVAHIPVNGNLPELLETIKKNFSNYNALKITGELFCNDFLAINNFKDMSLTEIFQITSAFQLLYYPRTQIQELNFNKDLIMRAFDIKNENQISVNFFTPSNTDLGAYTFAHLFTFIKIINQKAAIFNTCPLAESFFANYKEIPIPARIHLFKKMISLLLNPFYEKQKDDINLAAYGSLPFAYKTKQ